MSEAAKRTARIEARGTPAAVALVKRAAERQGCSVSDFVLAAAEREAERTLSEPERFTKVKVLHLSLADQEKVAEILSKPPAISPGLERAREAHRRLIRSSV